MLRGYCRDSYTRSGDFVGEDRERKLKGRCERCGLPPGKRYPKTNKKQTEDTECFGCGASWWEIPSEIWGDD